LSDFSTWLSDLKGVSEPLSKLIDSVRSVFGYYAEPSAIRRKAEAEAHANIILAKSRAQCMEIESRAMERVYKKEVRRQQNIESITHKATLFLPMSVSKEPISEDWVHQFYENCQDTNDDELKALWAKILAGEVSQPGSYSLRTLRTVKDMQFRDADLFTRFCSFIWMQGSNRVPVIHDKDGAYVKAQDISFEDFLHLQDLGLIQFNQLTSFLLQGLKGAAFQISYFGATYQIVIPPEKNDFHLGCSLLTRTGVELFSIAGGQPSESYCEAVLTKWREEGYLVVQVK